MEESKIIMERITRLDEKVQGIVNQLDVDRRDIDTIRMSQETLKTGNEMLINQMTDFKKEIRTLIQDTISQEIPKVVKREIRLLSNRNPRKIVKGRLGLLERIKTIFKIK